MTLAKSAAASLLLLASLLPSAFAGGDEKTATGVQPMASKRNYGSGRAALEIGGQSQTLESFAGTSMRVDGAPVSRDGKASARAATSVRCEEFGVELPIVPEPFVTQWIADALAGNSRAQEGVITESDFNYKPSFVHRLGALQLRSLELAELDANSKDRIAWSATLSAGSLKWEKPDGKSGDAKGAIGAKQKATLASNFRVTIGGVAYDRVTKVGPLHVDFAAPATTSDGSRTSREAAATRVTPFKLTLVEADPKEWTSWIDDVATKGAGAARSGTIELLDPGLKEVIAKIALDGLLPTRLSREGDGEKAPKLVIELACTAVKIDPAK